MPVNGDVARPDDPDSQRQSGADLPVTRHGAPR
jgi:hypothetical protein